MLFGRWEAERSVYLYSEGYFCKHTEKKKIKMSKHRKNKKLFEKCDFGEKKKIIII